jgi:hypothetical protein
MAALRDRLADRIERRLRAQLNWATIGGAVQGLSAPEKANLVLAVESGNGEVIGRIVMRAVAQALKAEAASQADSMLADGSLSAEELEQVL